MLMLHAKKVKKKNGATLSRAACMDRQIARQCRRETRTSSSQSAQKRTGLCEAERKNTATLIGLQGCHPYNLGDLNHLQETPLGVATQPNGAPLTSILFWPRANAETRTTLSTFGQMDASRGREHHTARSQGARVPHLVAGPHPRRSLGQFAAPPLHSEELVRQGRFPQY